LIDLSGQPEHDIQTFEDAAKYLRNANDLAVRLGIMIEPVGQACSPADALALVSGYLLALDSQATYLTATALAKALGCRRPTIMAHIRAGRIPAMTAPFVPGTYVS